MKKRKIQITIKILIITILHTLLCGVILKLILNGYVNIRYSNILNLEHNYIYLLYMGIYIVASILFIRKYYKANIKKMYLSCSLEEVDEMTGIEFEYFLYYKFRQRRYKAKTTPVTADYGADLVLRKGKERIVIQAKRYQNDVGITAVQEVIGSIAYYNATKGIVITNSYFTNNAKQLAKANDIMLWDRNKLMEEFIQEEAKSDLSYDEMNLSCPKCGKDLVYRKGKYGSFIGCSGYPNCKYTTSVDEISID